MSRINTIVFGTCAGPDFSKPLPGEVLQWTGKPNQTCPFPVGLFADNPGAVLGPCTRRNYVAPYKIHVLEVGEKLPRFF